MNNLKKLSIIGLACVLMSITITGLAGAYDPYYYDTTVDEGLLFGIGSLTCGIIIVIWIVVWLVLAIWVYKDAEKHSMSGILWALIVFFLGLIGLIIYLVIRSSHKGPQQSGQGSGRVCPSCGRPIPMDAQVCPYCGKDFRLK